MAENQSIITKFGLFTKKQTIELRLSYDRLIGKSLLQFNSALSKFDFSLLLAQLLNTGVRIHWNASNIKSAGMWNHLAIVDNEDINLIKLITDHAEVCPSDELFKELDDNDG